MSADYKMVLHIDRVVGHQAELLDTVVALVTNVEHLKSGGVLSPVKTVEDVTNGQSNNF